MTSPATRDESLETLTAMVNQTLIETGRFFRASGSMQARVQLKRNLPATHEQFQSALDNLSEQILIAKAFLEKDYNAIQQEKLESLPQKPQPAPTETIATNDGTSKAQAIPVQSTPDVVANLQPANQAQPQKSPQKPSSAPQPQQQNANTQPSATQPAESHPPLPSGGHEPITFDAMLADTSGTGAGTTGGIDIDMAFNADESANQAFFASANAFDVALSQHNDGKGAGSIGSLLPGLESYAGATGDEFNLDLQPGRNNNNNNNNNTQQVGDISSGNQDNGNAAQNNQQAAPVGSGGAPSDVPMEDLPAHESSNFDDLFVGAGDFDPDEENLLQNVEIGELDDSWLS
ncbi:hypothetical protein AJ80_09383 [Polytolypa hystricis UAMH7299]|uniref:Uncharacterized protein n=1 Tax=Polytolypa hystricis (strain UAMH7299) TaxID=1447883 RepID=A0A2B7WRF7_POLH7|nr:hypothetical protein AJ80_09383 [Polytolypa hystricis UAMH7299]